MDDASVIDIPPRPSAAVRGGRGRFPVRRIFCVGRNYAEHAIEMGDTGREPPFFFMKPADALLPVEARTTGEMPYPSLTQNLHRVLPQRGNHPPLGLQRDTDGNGLDPGDPHEIPRHYAVRW